MKAKVVFPKTVFESLRTHLLQDEQEQLAIILCGINKVNDELKFLCREVLKANLKDLDEASRVYVQVKDDFWRSALYRSKDDGYSILVCHSHPFSHGNVGFSSLDFENDKINYEYVIKKLPDIFIGGLVFGQTDIKGNFWDKERKEILDIDEIKVIGSTIEKIITDFQPASFSKDVYNRQILLFGEEGQKKFSQTSVAVVGCGGLGSITAELLARLGVGSIVLVDDDVLEKANLNRVIGSQPSLAGNPKVKVLKDHLEIFSNAEVEVFEKSVLDSSVLERLRDVDVIVSGTDTESSRMVLNELSVKYYIPYIDLAFGIIPQNKIEGYGQVRIVLPDGFCLNCIDGINYIQANEELMSEEDKEMRRAAGYIQGVPIPDPSVVSLDCVTASLGVTEFINLVCGIRPVNNYILYDMQSTNKIVTSITANKDEHCILCGEGGEQGMGDLSPVKNYLDTSMPNNIPKASKPRED